MQERECGDKQARTQKRRSMNEKGGGEEREEMKMLGEKHCRQMTMMTMKAV